MSKEIKTAILIPARYASSRFPGKSLKLLGEYTVIQHVWLRAQKVANVDYVAVVTDNEKIAKSVRLVGGEVIMSKNPHDNGTSRIAEAALELKNYDYIINLQGDEPLIDSNGVELFVDFLIHSRAEIATLKIKNFTSPIDDKNTVKVVSDINGRALYFSRSPIPFSAGESDFFYQHVGIYGFKREVLLKVTTLPPSSHEIAEKLEQLRWLQNGYDIHVLETEFKGVGIDVPADLIRAQDILDNY